jgi:acetyl esterase/lipase
MLSRLPDFKVDAHTLDGVRHMDWHEAGPAAEPAWERRLVAGPKGAAEVPVYVINAGPAGGSRPAIIHLHGGGYVAGTALSQVPYLQGIARELDCVVVTVDYRLAPETPFPGSLEDNYAALRWLFQSATALGVDPRRVAVMGESAGGGHAAMLALAARERGEFDLVMQVLLYPMLDDRTGSTRAVPAHIGSFNWTAYSNRYAWGAFLGRPAGSAAALPGSVPSREQDLSRLPPAFIGVGSIDLFVQEDVDYARRLLEAGVPVELQVVPGAYHAFDFVAPDAPLSKRFRAAQIGALRRAFG